MEYIDGDTLGAKIHAEKTPLKKLFKYLAQVAEGLGKAHAAGIVNGYASISLNSDSSILVAIQENLATDIWVAPNGDARRAKQFKSVSSNMDGLDCVRWTPDGKIVFNSMAGGRDGIWIMEADGKNRKQLSTAENVDYGPSVTTDGRYVVFVSERTGAPAGWVMNIDGSNQENRTLQE